MSLLFLPSSWVEFILFTRTVPPLGGIYKFRTLNLTVNDERRRIYAYTSSQSHPSAKISWTQMLPFLQYGGII